MCQVTGSSLTRTVGHRESDQPVGQCRHASSADQDHPIPTTSRSSFAVSWKRRPKTSPTNASDGDVVVKRYWLQSLSCAVLANHPLVYPKPLTQAWEQILPPSESDTSAGVWL